MPTVQPTDPTITLVRTPAGETTLLIDDVQAMQGWERQLMWRSADLLCARGGEFLEAGLGLGLSAQRIAARPGTRRHVVVEKYAKVIELFRAEHPRPPQPLEIVNADFFDYADRLEPESFDGIFFDPELPREMFEDRALLDAFVPKLVRALRPGGTFVPMFSISGEVPDAATCTASPGTMLDRYARFFDRVVVERHPYRAYADTRYTPDVTGEAYVFCFAKGGAE
jgi:predicted methyltransferase